MAMAAYAVTVVLLPSVSHPPTRRWTSTGLGALLQGLNPEHVEIWPGPGPEKGVGVGERPPGAVNLGGWEPFGE